MLLAGSLLLALRDYLVDPLNLLDLLDHLDPLDLGDKWLGLLGYLLLFAGLVGAVIIVVIAFVVGKSDKPAKPAESAKSVGSAESSPVTVAVWITLVISSVLMVLAGSLLLAFRDYLVDHLDLDDLEDQWLGLLGGFLLFAGLVGVVIIVVIAFVVGKSDKPAKPAGQGGTAGQGGSRRSGSPGKSPPPSPVAVAVLITLVILSGLMCLAGGLLIDSEIARVSDGSIGSAFRFLGYLLCFGGFVTAVIAFVVNAAVNKSVGSAESSPGSVAVIIILLILSVFMLLAGLVLLVFRYYQVDPLKLLDLVNQKEEVNQVEVKRRNLR
ncbi:MFS transporter superfamily [Babesia duncani]|uniref:MFS transporter superfamily n=1 Tax=Babesia duncani TaxID=323732 RepID=A0AAD9UM62_9APIC|nr:MFS transporter superfamily [Babesia duncani]